MICEKNWTQLPLGVRFFINIYYNESINSRSTPWAQLLRSVQIWRVFGRFRRAPRHAGSKRLVGVSSCKYDFKYVKPVYVFLWFFLQLKGCLKRQDAVFRDPAIHSCFMILDISWLVCFVLEKYPRKKLHLIIQSRIFFTTLLKGPKLGYSATFMSATLSWMLQNNAKYSNVVNFYRASESYFSISTLNNLNNSHLLIFW